MTQNDTEFFKHNFWYSVVFTRIYHRIFCILWFLTIINHRISCILISLISLIPWNGSTFLFTNQIGSNLVQSLLTTVPSFPSNFWNFQFKGQILDHCWSHSEDVIQISRKKWDRSEAEGCGFLFHPKNEASNDIVI